LVLPPKIAPTQVVIIPILGNDDSNNSKVMSFCENIKNNLIQTELVRVKIDTSEKSFGDKSYYWEKRGVPVRIEVGMRDIENDKYFVTRRDLKQKTEVSFTDIPNHVINLLSEIQLFLFHQAQSRLGKQLVSVKDYEEFKKKIEEGKGVYAYFDEDPKIEARIKEETKATTRCRPFKRENDLGPALFNGSENSKLYLFAKSY